ncbi:ATPase inhibitor mitochondrial precursor [Dissophora ornata]|nr:hypothetical protein BGZ58_009863 [Dissophora ornata]KAI8597054.1 ATPase inhibitor mitochondrial precursor [Dissophora ornata]
MLRTTSTVAIRAFKPVQVAYVARCSYTTTGSFSEKEKAEEVKYIRAKEAEQIKKLKEQLAQREKEIADLKKEKK